MIRGQKGKRSLKSMSIKNSREIRTIPRDPVRKIISGASKIPQGESFLQSGLIWRTLLEGFLVKEGFKGMGNVRRGVRCVLQHLDPVLWWWLEENIIKLKFLEKNEFLWTWIAFFLFTFTHSYKTAVSNYRAWTLWLAVTRGSSLDLKKLWNYLSLALLFLKKYIGF